MDWLHTFPMYKGKSNCDDEEEDESERTMGKYKVFNKFLTSIFVT